MSDVAQEIEEMVLSIHRRNGGTLNRLNLELRLLDSSLGLDSLDLAEIVVAIEKRFHHSLFDAGGPPKTWGDVVRDLELRKAGAVESSS